LTPRYRFKNPVLFVGCVRRDDELMSPFACLKPWLAHRLDGKIYIHISFKNTLEQPFRICERALFLRTAFDSSFKVARQRSCH